MDEECLHIPLKFLSREIRLLRLDDTSEGALSCHLETVSLDNNPQFAALSYLWGDPAATEDVIVNGQQVAVTVNLASALRHVKKNWTKLYPSRDPDSFRLWADALCINQNDVEERSQQVMLMGDVYSNAELVFSWLGAGESRLEIALDTVRLLTEELAEDTRRNSEGFPTFMNLKWMRKYPYLCTDDKDRVYNVRWRDMGFLFNMTYWRRVWVQQELALAKRIILAYGPKILEFDIFNPLGMLVRSLSKVELFPREKPSFLGHNTWQALRNQGLIDWKLLVRVIFMREMVMDRRKLDDPLRAQADSWSHAEIGFTLQSTDPKDHIYGLLGITQLDIVPDYSMKTPLPEVYIQYTKRWLQFSEGQRGSQPSGLPLELWFLKYSGIGLLEETLGFPSWTPNYPQTRKENPTMIYSTNCQADHDVFPEQTKSAIIDGTSLNVSGIAVDVVSHTAAVPVHEEMHKLRKWAEAVNAAPVGSELRPPIEALKPMRDLREGYFRPFVEDFIRRHPTYVTGIPALQAVFRAFTRDANYLPDDTTLSYALGFLGTLCGLNRQEPPSAEDLSPQGPRRIGLPAGTAFNEAFTRVFAPTSPVIVDVGVGDEGNFLQATYRSAPIRLLAEQTVLREDFIPLQTTWRFFETARGYVGFGPDLMKPGDVVSVVQGMDHPVLLRKTGNKYEHVGVSFVEGLMRGEARELLHRQKCEIERFEIV